MSSEESASNDADVTFTALEVVQDGEDAKAAVVMTQQTEPEKKTMIVKNLPTGEIREVQFYDPYMEANTDATLIDPWAAILFGFPVLLLADDVFHFLPEKGIVGVIQEVFH